MAIVLAMMAVIVSVVYYTVREYMLEEAQDRYEGVLQRDHEEFRRRLSDVVVATRNNLDDIERDIDHPETAITHLEHILHVNPTILSCGIAYIPDYFPKRGRYLEIVSTRDSAGVTHLRKIENDYNIYIERKWFREGIEKDTAHWSEVYFEYDLIPGITGRRQVTTYSEPVHNLQRQPVALFCADLPLDFLRYEMMDDLQEKIKIYEKGSTRHSYNFVIDHEGTYIIHPDESHILNANFFEEAKETSNKIDDHVMNSMKKGEKGSAMVEIDGVPSWIYYRTVKHMDWVIAIVVPEEVIFYNGRLLNTIILLIMLVGLLVIYLFCRRMIKDITTPVAVQQAAIERELKIAHGIQMAMLPKTFPPYPERTDIDIYASETPAREVGGDLYDYFLRDNRLFFCIGDVSGKGMPAALMMAVMRAMFRSETRRADNAVDIVETMNRNLSEEYTAGYFVTMFVGILDLNTGHLDYCNAGSEAPLAAGSPLPIQPNLPIGALADWDYEGQQTQLKSGDMLFLYTDGLTEAKNQSGEQLGRRHVIRLAGEHAGATAQELIQFMEQEVHHHAADTEQSDDITLLAIKWTNNSTGFARLYPQVQELSMRASMDDIGCLQPFIERVAEQAGIDNKESKRLRLAVEEAVANTINYGQATTITLRASKDDNLLTLTIDDDGQPFDPTQDSATDLSVPPDQRPSGGMGIILLHTMTDGLAYQRTDGHNILTISKNIKQ